MKTYTLLGGDGKSYASQVPGTLGGHRRMRIYGRLDCPAALRAIAKGGYVRNRVFFADEGVAIAAGFRPCCSCLPGKYRAWKTAQALVSLAARMGARTVAIGSGRDEATLDAVRRFTLAWETGGGVVLETVSWPEEAASWLRQARRLTGQDPDLWMLGGAGTGLAEVVRRLARSTSWSARRTLGFGGIEEAVRIAGTMMDGLRGADDDGGLWHVVDGAVEAVHQGSVR